jgi:sortase (surface protein transpeptidase)
MPILISFLSFVFAIVQQPKGCVSCVTAEQNAVTQYQGDSITVRLLAHNDKAGAAFFKLQAGDSIKIDMANGSKYYIVSDVLKYRTLFPANVDPPIDKINFMGADGIGITTIQLFNLIYNKEDRLVLQTCYDGVSGRLFVIAYPVQRDSRKDGRK